MLKKLLALNPSKSCGPDQMHPRMLKELANEIAPALTELFNKSLEEGVVPLDWRVAAVSPIFKKGKKCMAENYRPVSLTSIVCKVLEGLVREAMIEYLTARNLLSPKQFGFLGKRSTMLQLLTYLDYCSEAIGKGLSVDAIYLDFQKAFDTVPHRRLLTKLEGYGIDSKLIKWIQSFLSDRTQHVTVNGSKSREEPVISGVPQGSVLGPLLFVLYINDLPDNLECMALMFADDTKVYQEIRSEEDIAAIQRDLGRLEEWSAKWLLLFHPGKCKVLTLGDTEKLVRPRAGRYELHETILEHEFEEKDLGVIIDNHMKFDVHIEEKIKKANTMLGMIQRSFSYLNKQVFLPLYKALVRHYVESGAILWSGIISRSQVRALEKVQMRALNMIQGMDKLTYEEQLQELKLPSLAARRSRGMMIEMWKHHHVYDKDILTPSFQTGQSARRPLDCRRFAAKGLHAKTFYSIAATVWNRLPYDIRHKETINSFKSAIDSYWSQNLPQNHNYLSDPPWKTEDTDDRQVIISEIPRLA